MLEIATALGMALMAQAAVTDEAKEIYSGNSGRCLRERAAHYLNGDDLRLQSRMLAAECLSYMPSSLVCPSLANILSPAELEECTKDDDKMVADIKRVTEDHALQALTIASIRKNME